MKKKIFNNRLISFKSTQFSDSEQQVNLSKCSQESSDGEKEIKKSLLSGSRAILLLSTIFIVLLALTNRYWMASFSTVITSLSRKSSALKSEKLPSGNVQPVKTLIAKRVDSYQVSRTYTGEITASRTSELGFKRSDELVRIAVNEGDYVKIGTPLAYLDTSSLKTQEKEILAERSQASANLQELLAGPRTETIAAARASVKNILAQLELSQKKKSRREKLYAEGAISREQLDEASFEESSFQARLQEAKSRLQELEVGTRPEQIQAQKALINRLDASLDRIKIEQDKSILKAPFSGTIAVRQTDEGIIVTPGQPILRLVENDKIEIRVGIPITATEQLPLNSYQKLQIGQKTYSARVSAILPELNSQTRTAIVVLNLDKPENLKLLPGQIARLKLEKTINSSGYWLPTTALIRRGRGLWSCYVLGEALDSKSNGSQNKKIFRLQQRGVEVLYNETDKVFVDGTLEDGDKVVINGTHRLVSGQLVNLIP